MDYAREQKSREEAAQQERERICTLLRDLGLVSAAVAIENQQQHHHREPGFYWVRFKQRDFTDPQRTHGDNAWPWLEDEYRQVAYYYDTQPAPPRWYCLGAFRDEDEFEAIGARLPNFDGQSNEYQRGWLDAMMRVRKFEDREVGRVVANWLAEPRIRGF